MQSWCAFTCRLVWWSTGIQHFRSALMSLGFGPAVTVHSGCRCSDHQTRVLSSRMQGRIDKGIVLPFKRDYAEVLGDTYSCLRFTGKTLVPWPHSLGNTATRCLTRHPGSVNLQFRGKVQIWEVTFRPSPQRTPSQVT